ncbi:hypothetical protein GCM10017786_76070 [Amycolatopsis deserti]|uniref:Phage tail tape measure protein domain-containing protein n=2 Tax=Actinomycetes TaxID=1760 RepID=A0ABQ3JL47_9PSEU|nr:phage tail tape measure protein [Amycolatopsis deserti]GHF30978.1 hypothetical protein GCM10017786_76070 [Amycolatopsis deserti]
MAGLGPTVKLVFAGDASQLDKTMKDVGDSGDRMVKEFSAKSAGLALAGGIAATGLVDAFQQNLDMGAANAKLEAQLGAGSELAAAAGEIAGNLYADAYGDSLATVNDAVKTVLQSGALMEDASNDQIQAITANAMSLSEAFGVDVQSSMNAVAQLMRTGLAPSAEAALDVITRGFQQGVDKGGDFLDTLNEYSTQFRKLGLDATTATGLMSQGLQAGARDADVVADALKEFSIRAVDGTKTTADGFKMLGLNADQMAAQIAQGGQTASAGLDVVLDRLRDIKDPVLQSQAAVALFGTQAEDLGAALYALDPSTAVAALGNVDGAAATVNETLSDTAQNKITALQRGFQDWTNSLVTTNGPLGELAAGVMAFGQPALTMLSSIGMIALAFQGFGMTLLTTVVPAVWSFTTALLANPITWIVLGVVALIAAIVLLITHFDQVKAVATTVISWIGDRFEWVRNLVGNIAGWIRDRFVDAFNWVRSTAGGVFDWFGSLPGRIGAVFSGIGDGIKNAFKAAFNFVADIWNNTVGRISITIPSWVPVIGGNSFSAPKIPKFHTGGVVPGTPGSEMLAILQAGETVVPANASGGAGAIVIRGDGSPIAAVLIEVLSEAIRGQGGNVQEVLGG